MTYTRFIGILLIILGISISILSFISYAIGIYPIDNESSFGIVNSIGIASGCVLLLLGFLIDNSAGRTALSVIKIDEYSRIDGIYFHLKPIPSLATGEAMIKTTRLEKASIQTHEKNDEYNFECPTCRTDVSESETSCPICGEEFE